MQDNWSTSFDHVGRTFWIEAGAELDAARSMMQGAARDGTRVCQVTGHVAGRSGIIDDRRYFSDALDVRAFSYFPLSNSTHPCKASV
jgi:hypothetical protein